MTTFLPILQSNFMVIKPTINLGLYQLREMSTITTNDIEENRLIPGDMGVSTDYISERFYFFYGTMFLCVNIFRCPMIFPLHIK